MKENFPSTKKAMDMQGKPKVDRVCDEDNLQLREDQFPQMTMVNVLIMIGKNTTTYENLFFLIKCTLIF